MLRYVLWLRAYLAFSGRLSGNDVRPPVMAPSAYAATRSQTAAGRIAGANR